MNDDLCKAYWTWTRGDGRQLLKPNELGQKGLTPLPSLSSAFPYDPPEVLVTCICKGRKLWRVESAHVGLGHIAHFPRGFHAASQSKDW